MKNKIITITILLLLMILFFWGEDEKDLGDNYYYLPDYEAIDIGFPEGAIVYKGTQMNMFDEIKIHRTVVSASSNKDFILAIRKLEEFSIEKDSLQHYIIVKKTDSVHGPYNNSEYIKKRKEFGVSKKLKLGFE
jgi:hypothetical protein